MQPNFNASYLASQGLSATFPERFFDKVHKTETCWIWTAFTIRFGYGSIARGPKHAGPILAHVASWILHYGPVPEGKCVLHSCDNPPCVNPQHLWLGTHGDNCKDKIDKGRMRWGISTGEKHGLHKLTWEKVRQARLDYAKGDITIYALSQRYGVNWTAMSLCLRRITWKDDPHEP